ncbi:ubiquinol-cytochrome c reductase subunit 6 [Blastomyces silverae]|uniref:Ubiquinol-cytochrome c reductase subunit 6 n=1 Tax=Blastomyces silverae TaxID=2060906 RepID=A0A0H1BJ06_9EURO|nr:ubiquinol-cytochrome c reductase subunit 6 [Blastomyces silverae]
MGLVDMFTDLISSLPFAEAQAEAPPAEEPAATDAPEEKEEEPEEQEEEEEEEEEEVEDIKPKLEEECANSAKCAPAKHHFEECVERVTRNSEDPDFKGPHEDCVEECKFKFSYHVFLGILPAGSRILLRHIHTNIYHMIRIQNVLLSSPIFKIKWVRTLREKMKRTHGQLPPKIH